MTRVAVIWAGFAGLAAADALAAAGLDVIVLEARDRVGGRVWSQALPDGSIIERGAEFILPDDSLVREVAQRFGLALFEKGTLYGDREPRGGPPVTRPELVAAFETVRSSVSSGDLRGRSVREVLDALPLHEGARAAILARVEVSTAYPADDQDASVLLEGATTLGDFRRTRSRGATSGSPPPSRRGSATGSGSGRRSGGSPGPRAAPASRWPALTSR
jgi:phytoene dehydrogenase-like protein